MKKTLLMLSIFTLLFFGCENPIEPTQTSCDSLYTYDSSHVVKIENIISSVFVINEGGFAQNNSSVSKYVTKELLFYNMNSEIDSIAESFTISQDVFYNTNSSNIGDTGNDMVITEDKGYIALTGSNKIEVVNVEDFKIIGAIDFTAFGGPRKIAFSNAYGYATTSNSMIVKFDPATLAVLDTITVGFKPEGIVSAAGKLFVVISGWGAGNTVAVIDEATFKQVNEITVKINPTNIINNGYDIYVVSTGTYSFSGGDGMGMLTKIDALTMAVTDTLQIDKNPGRIAMGNDEELFLINGDGIVHIGGATMSIITNTLISGAVVNSLYASIYSVAYDADNDLLYLGNPKDYSQNGDVAIFDLNGNEEGRFDVGINPGTIVFKK